MENPTKNDRGALEVSLRDVEAGDLEVFFEHQADPEAARMAGFPSRTREAHMAHWNNKILSNATGLAKTITAHGTVTGNILSWQQGEKREVGYWIGKEHWGKGIATSALSLFLDIDLTRPLYAHVVAHNRGSIRVLEKCGFRIVDRKREDDVEEVVLVLER